MSEWIDAKKGLPPEDKLVLLFVQKGFSDRIRVGFLSDAMHHEWELLEGGPCEPTHWQPLPEPPK